jgi:very-short-patch-repair endonuclease
VDYYIEEEKIAIEYDGEQHYRPIIGLYGCKTLREAEVNLKQIQRRDKRKEQLCRENGWRLIRIRYDESLTIQQVRQKIRKESFIKSEKQHFDHKGVKC